MDNYSNEATDSSNPEKLHLVGEQTNLPDDYGVVSPHSDDNEQWEHKYYSFELGAHHFIAPQGLFCELLIGCSISPMPNSPKYFVGLTNVRGNLVPVYRLEPFLGIQNIASKYVFLLGPPQEGAALIVSEKPKTMSIPAEKFTQSQNAKHNSIRSAFSRYTKIGKTKHYTLDHETLFSILASPNLMKDHSIQENSGIQPLPEKSK